MRSNKLLSEKRNILFLQFWATNSNNKNNIKFGVKDEQIYFEQDKKRLIFKLPINDGKCGEIALQSKRFS